MISGRRVKQMHDSMATVPLTDEQAAAAFERLTEIVEHHLKRLTATEPLEVQMKQLALDAFVRGLVDGYILRGRSELDGVDRIDGDGEVPCSR